MDKKKWILIGGLFYSKKKNARGYHIVASFLPFEGYRVIKQVKELPKV